VFANNNNNIIIILSLQPPVAATNSPSKSSIGYKLYMVLQNFWKMILKLSESPFTFYRYERFNKSLSVVIAHSDCGNLCVAFAFFSSMAHGIMQYTFVCAAFIHACIVYSLNKINK
jgi:hypothetical protein